MSRAVAKSEPTLPGITPDAEAQRIVEDVISFYPDDGSPVSLRRDLTRPERDLLDGRKLQLNAILRPVSDASEERRRTAEALAAMFLGFPSMRNVDAQTMITAYVLHLESLPLFAVMKACEDVVRKRVKDLDSDWPPTSPRMYEIAERHVFPVEGERLMIEKALVGRVPEVEKLTPEAVERIGAKAMALSQELNKKVERERSETDARTLAELAAGSNAAIMREYQRLGVEPKYADKAKTILLSPGLAGIREKRSA